MQTLKFTAESIGGRASRAHAGRHEITFDMPPKLGGTGLGPGPLAYFAASVAGCVHYHASGVLAEHGHAADGLSVDVVATPPEDGGRRLESFACTVHLPEGVPEDLHAAIEAKIQTNPVWGTLRTPPEITLELLPA
jgi:uncharacterized OsmC-like protein